MLVMESDMLPGLDLFYSFDDRIPDHFYSKYASLATLPEGPITLRVQAYRSGQPVWAFDFAETGRVGKKVRVVVLGYWEIEIFWERPGDFELPGRFFMRYR